MTTAAVPRSFSLELALVVGLPLITIVAGAYAMCLAYTQGFTPVPQAAAPVAQVGH